ncbi:site-specific DNA-methyltransferase [Candidatus Soleaferrea massiliensis]|uniref:site-specific DNA-methyltransferase n=1 Tax=Candidatus Soleaferrea massiliensis TaxID=1470354 RepID=UPI00058D84FD|nr:DNA methyltransferase [Candidatus Soleaferrea massiliensis]
MAAINDLINQIDNPELQARIQAEVDRMNKQKKFGLVFEEHLPECTPLYDIPIKQGSTVARKTGKVSENYVVLKIEEDTVICMPKGSKDEVKIPLTDLVAVAEFGEAIYPCLRPVDTICNAPDSELWHTLIEADNYHALQLLEYLYAGKVDCIYIDPPYNTGAKDWKYNNDYVDNNDAYRHSKWLSMMQKRLRIAKKLLNSKDSVLIVTIDEKEYLHLGCLLEEMFPEARLQMISSVINPKGNRRDNEFSRCEEYIFFIYVGNAYIISNGSDMLRDAIKDDNVEQKDRSVRLRALLRQASNHGKRTDRPNLFYPLIFKKDTGEFLGPGPVPNIEEDRNTYEPPEGTVAMWPIGSNGTELTWNLQPETLMAKQRQHFLSFGKWNGKGRTGYYLSESQENNFNNGMYDIVGQDEDGAYIIELKSSLDKDIRPLTIWHKKSHSASEYGTMLLNGFFHDRRFSFPKSLYAVKDTLRFFVANKPNALIIDFFAGSGTTQHAVNLLNAEDGGHRRCIMVTNNEVSVDEAKSLTKQGYHPGDPEWEKLGIARYVTWPRTVCSIEGHDVNGNPLKGNYLGSDISMADGFKSNVAYFKLGFLDKTSVALGRQFKEMLPTLWMKAGSYGPCPEQDGDEIPAMLVLPENKLAILTEESAFPDFQAKVNAQPEIQTVFIVTDYEAGYRAMAKNLNASNTYQLYRDYLDNFRINTGRN